VRRGAVLAGSEAGFVFALKGSNCNEFWCYDVAADSWSQLDGVPLGPRKRKVRRGCALASLGTETYCLKGGGREFWKYQHAAFSVGAGGGLTQGGSDPTARARSRDGVASTAGDSGNPTNPRLVYVYDACGRRVASFRIGTRAGLDGLVDVRAGAYFLIDTQGRTVAKVVLTR
jgi:hypothetical protein